MINGPFWNRVEKAFKTQGGFGVGVFCCWYFLLFLWGFLRFLQLFPWIWEEAKLFKAFLKQTSKSNSLSTLLERGTPWMSKSPFGKMFPCWCKSHRQSKSWNLGFLPSFFPIPGALCGLNSAVWFSRGQILPGRILWYKPAEKQFPKKVQSAWVCSCESFNFPCIHNFCRTVLVERLPFIVSFYGLTVLWLCRAETQRAKQSTGFLLSNGPNSSLV